MSSNRLWSGRRPVSAEAGREKSRRAKFKSAEPLRIVQRLTLPKMGGIPDYLKDQAHTLEKALANVKQTPSKSR
jgi:hypothetical protein